MASTNSSEEDSLQCLQDVLCGRELHDMYSEYYKFEKELVALYMSDTSTTCIVNGPGYNNLAILHDIQNFGEHRFLLRSRPSRQSVYLVNRSCVVLEDRGTEYVANQPVLLYASAAEAYGADYNKDEVVLHLSSRTYSLVHREEFGLPLRDSIVVRMDGHRVPKFHLSALKYKGLFSGGLDKKFLMFGTPPVAINLRGSYIGEPIGDDENDSDTTHLWYESQKPTIRSLCYTPAFQFSGWPTVAVSWASRDRKWPPRSLVQDVMACPIYLTPTANNQDLHTPEMCHNIDDMKYTADLVWTLQFWKAEDTLFSALSLDARNVFLVLQVLLHENPDSYPLLKTMFLWCMEQFGPGLGAQTLHARVIIVLKKFEQFLQTQNVPHYFVQDTNLISKDKSTECVIDLLQSVRFMQQYPVKTILGGTGFEALQNVINDLDNNGNMIQQIRKNLLSAAGRSLFSITDENTRLFSIELYQKLHTSSLIPENISLHQSVLSRLTEVKQGASGIKTELIDSLQDFVNSSLGNLYFVHGLQAYFAKEKTAFFEKSQHHFGLVSDETLAVSKIRSVLLDAKRGQHQRVVDTLLPVLEKLLTERPLDGEQKMHNATETDVRFPESLLKIAIDSIRSLDVLVMKQEKQAYPRDITKNLGLAQFQLLGCTRQPVSVLDSPIVCGYLIAQSYTGLGKPSSARDILARVEDFCLKDESDLNEKRGCVYLNMLAEAYIRAEDVEQGKYLLQRSLAIMPNPRNPGRWALMSVQTQRAREYVIGGVGVAIATAVTAVAVNFLLNKK